MIYVNDLFGDQNSGHPHGSVLAVRFILPPFTVLNAREGWWQERKRAWLALGIKSELGRGGNHLGLSAQVRHRFRPGNYE